MKYQLGDKVIIMDSSDSGTVVDILDNGNVLVDVNGFAIPVLEKDLMLQGRYDAPDEEDKGTSHIRGTDTGIFVAFVPVNDENGTLERFRFYLVNDIKGKVGFSFGLVLNERERFSLKKEVNAYSTFYLADLVLDELNDNPALQFKLKITINHMVEYVEKTVKPKAKSLFKAAGEVPLMKEAAIALELYREKAETKNAGQPGQRSEPVHFDKEYLIQQMFESNSGHEKQFHVEDTDEVVDLHIERLVTDYEKLSKEERLRYQLDVFIQSLERAISHNFHQLIIIHGLGKGKLRDEIHRILHSYKRDNQIKNFSNSYDPRFGFGATVIYL